LPLESHIQDGEYADVTKQFEIQYADMKKFMVDLLVRKRKKKSDVEEEN